MIRLSDFRLSRGRPGLLPPAVNRVRLALCDLASGLFCAFDQVLRTERRNRLRGLPN